MKSRIFVAAASVAQAEDGVPPPRAETTTTGSADPLTPWLGRMNNWLSGLFPGAAQEQSAQSCGGSPPQGSAPPAEATEVADLGRGASLFERVAASGDASARTSKRARAGDAPGSKAMPPQQRKASPRSSLAQNCIRAVTGSTAGQCSVVDAVVQRQSSGPRGRAHPIRRSGQPHRQTAAHSQPPCMRNTSNTLPDEH